MSPNQGVTVSSAARRRGPVGQGRMAWTEPTRQCKAQRQDGNKAGQPRLLARRHVDSHGCPPASLVRVGSGLHSETGKRMQFQKEIRT